MSEPPLIAADTNVLLDLARGEEILIDCFMLKPWGFQPVNCVPVGHGIVHRIAETIREKGLLPESEINDSLIVAEAGLLGISILLSSDGHLKEIPHHDLRLIMDAADVRTPLIASPWKIVHEFFH